MRFVCLLGTGYHFQSFIIFVNQHQWIPQIFSVFMLFWLTAFVIGFSQLVLGKKFFEFSFFLK
jgi:hypothetical protein